MKAFTYLLQCLCPPLCWAYVIERCRLITQYAKGHDERHAHPVLAPNCEPFINKGGIWNGWVNAKVLMGQQHDDLG